MGFTQIVELHKSHFVTFEFLVTHLILSAQLGLKRYGPSCKYKKDAFEPKNLWQLILDGQRVVQVRLGTRQKED